MNKKPLLDGQEVEIELNSKLKKELKEMRKKLDERDGVNFCSSFVDKIIGKKTIENKTRYLLEDFFFNEGWASMTNPKAMKEGHSQQYTYNKSNISHFIEDFVRLFQREWDLEWQKILKKKKTENKD